jgi:FkbM family methyltransferase
MVTAAEALAAALHWRQVGDLTRAEQLCRQVLQAEPANVEALQVLGVVCSDVGRPAEAANAFQAATRLRPDNAFAWDQLGLALFALGRVQEAVPCYQQALRIQPTFVEARCNLGSALYRVGDAAQAAACFQEALLLEPNRPELHFNLGNAQAARGLAEEAIACFRQAVRLKPDFAMAHMNLGTTLISLGEDEEALESFRRAVQLEPDKAEMHNNLATALLEQGQQEDAVAHFREALRLNPSCTPALVSVAVQDLFPLSADDVGRMEALLANPQLPPMDAATLEFGLGNLRQRAGAFDEAFEYFRRGNARRRGIFHQTGLGFHPPAFRALVDRLIATFDAAYFQRARGFGLDSELPVFIVGMPRSGTSLVEQIIASHPRAHGAGELRDVARIVEKLSAELGAREPYPECLAGARAEQVRPVAERQLRRLAGLGGDALRVLDKMPDNFLQLGLIATLFPRARVIHCRRDPMDTCVSCYLSYFRGLHFTWDLDDLGKYYRQYERLMAHWRQVLPLPLYEVQYEDLVANQEKVSRELVAFCGLDWDDRCLSPHETRRPVHTVSVLQVRRPVYTSSVGRWRRYEAYLEPLKAALAGPDEPPAPPAPPPAAPAPAPAVAGPAAAAWPANFPTLRQVLNVELPTVAILDVGAMAEGVDRYAPLLAQGLASVTGFEPNPEELHRLRATRPGTCRYLPHVLGKGGPATFHVTRYPGCSSLYPPDPAVIDLFTSIGTGEGGNFRVLRTEPVQTTRLDDVPDCPPADYLKLDVQGAELDVLQGGARALAHALVLDVEVEFVPLYKGQPLFGDVQVFLRDHGFVLHKLVDVAGRAFHPLAPGGNPCAPVSQVLWADAVFVRDFTALDRLTPEQLLKAAAVLHDVYWSYDLVHRLLEEYDRRLGTDLVRRYDATVLSGRSLPTLYMNLKLDP